MSGSKLGSYIQSLMATVLDKEATEFVRDLAYGELKRINLDVGDFLRTHQKDDSEERKQTEKQLLQEEKDGTNR